MNESSDAPSIDMALFDKIRGSPATVHDPVCGMDIDPTKAAGKSVHGGETYFFCSPGCKTKFDADPHKFLSGHKHAH
ncbi:MAG: YHS domain-containing protein [Thermoplasmatota archaeon]